MRKGEEFEISEEKDIDPLVALRAATRDLNITDCLGVLGKIDRFRHFGRRIKLRGFPSPIKYDYLNSEFGFPWERDLLAEAVINYGSYIGQRSFLDIAVFTNALHASRNYCIDSKVNFDDVSIWNYMAATLYQQLPDQKSITIDDIMIFHAIYSQEKSNKSLIEVFGFNADQLFLHIFLIYSLFLNSVYVSWPPPITGIKYNADIVRILFSIATSDISNHRAHSSENKLASQKNKFRLSPFVLKPICHINISNTELWCPFVGHLIRRMTYGLYYDLIEDKNFLNNIGYDFEKYAGIVLERNNPGNWSILPERNSTGKRPKSSCDWLVSDGNSNLFIECKYKRPVLDSKIDPTNRDIVNSDLEKYATFIAQAIMAAERDRAGLFPGTISPGGNFILILTPEDWHILFGENYSFLRPSIEQKLSSKGFESALVDQYGILTCVAKSFELLISTAKHFGLTHVLEDHSSDQNKRDFTQGFIASKYSGKKGFYPKSIWKTEFDRVFDISLIKDKKDV